jgi:hypothetical protein
VSLLKRRLERPRFSQTDSCNTANVVLRGKKGIFRPNIPGIGSLLLGLMTLRALSRFYILLPSAVTACFDEFMIVIFFDTVGL